MKYLLIILLFFTIGVNCPAQSYEVQQLLLNVEKLAQFKQILSDLKKGYEIASKGYTTIKNISEGNFSLHKVFLDGLLEVSPTVRKYKRVADIIQLQLQLMKEYKAAFNRFKANNNFSVTEIGYIGRVYNNLFNASVRDLEDLLTVITANQLRMSDNERLTAIDKIFKEMQNKVGFLRHFNNSTAILGIQRSKEQNDVNVMRKLYNAK
jgi:hypothetical protein